MCCSLCQNSLHSIWPPEENSLCDGNCYAFQFPCDNTIFLVLLHIYLINSPNRITYIETLN